MSGDEFKINTIPKIEDIIGYSLIPNPVFAAVHHASGALMKKLNDGVNSQENISVSVDDGFNQSEFDLAVSQGNIIEMERLLSYCQIQHKNKLSAAEIMAMQAAEKVGFTVGRDDDGQFILAVDPIDDEGVLADKLVALYSEASRTASGIDDYKQQHPLRTQSLVKALNKGKLTDEQFNHLLSMIHLAMPNKT
ncbi:MAG: hypothetical protein PHV54_00965 [Tolumonas sp.]|nr:hypothetical protein [Tolumonas sp.]